MDPLTHWIVGDKTLNVTAPCTLWIPYCNREIQWSWQQEQQGYKSCGVCLWSRISYQKSHLSKSKDMRVTENTWIKVEKYLILNVLYVLCVAKVSYTYTDMSVHTVCRLIANKINTCSMSSPKSLVTKGIKWMKYSCKLQVPEYCTWVKYMSKCT